MSDIAWDAEASFNGRSATLEDCVRAWKRDVQRGVGAIGTITTAHVFNITGIKRPGQQLSAVESWRLAEALPPRRDDPPSKRDAMERVPRKA